MRPISLALIVLVCCGLARAETADLDGIELYWYAEGEGPAIVLVHGWTCDTTVWADQIDAFSDRYRVIVLDLPGHGLSGSPEDGVYTMDLYADAVEAVRVAAAVDEALLVGHSMGAPVIAHYALSHPDRVAGLVAVDGDLLARFEGAAPEPDGSQRSFREQLVDSMFVPETSMRVRDDVLHMMLAPSDDHATAVGSAMATFSVEPGARIDAPALSVLSGTAEPPDAEALRRVIPDVTVTTIDGTGHFLMMERPDDFDALLAGFIDRIGF